MNAPLCITGQNEGVRAIATWQDHRIVARFWKYANPSSGRSGCWVWKGPLKTAPTRPANQRYGQLQIQRNKVRRYYRAHVLSWEIANQCDWPVGKIARHSCDNPPCCNPAHITPGTPADNSADAVLRGRSVRQGWANREKTHCKFGHPLAPPNLYRSTNGQRICAECRRRMSLQYYYKKKGVAA